MQATREHNYNENMIYSPTCLSSVSFVSKIDRLNDNRPCFTAEFTNLIIVRNGRAVQTQGSAKPEPNKFANIQFQMIKYEQLQWVCMEHI